MNLDKLDKILVENSEVEEINKWIMKNEELYKIAKPILNEGLLYALDKESTEQYGSMNGVLYFKHIDDSLINFKIYMKQGSNLVHMANFDGVNLLNKIQTLFNEDEFNNYDFLNNYAWTPSNVVYNDKFAVEFAKTEKSKSLKKLMSGFMRMYFNVITYAQFYNEQITHKIVRNTVKVGSSKKNKNKSNNHKVRLTKVYNLNVDREKLKSFVNPHKTYERHAESWTVKGHPRYYKKTGKTIWVKPYVKGDKNKVVGKTYTV